MIVITAHLFIGAPSTGYYAVFGFYVLSGYLMTLIMQETYGYTSTGRYKFAANRFLRLYPQYWAAAGISILMIYLHFTDVHESIYLPTTLQGILSNLTMIFPAWSPINVEPRLVPPTWAITVEIFFYVLICLGLSKTFARAKLWLLVSIGYVVVSFALHMPAGARYDPIWAASLPFSVGAVTYFLSKDRQRYARYFSLPISSRILFVVMLANFLLGTYVLRTRTGMITEIGTYINLVICALLVYKITGGDAIARISQSTDKWIADFSYPLYLLQWQVIITVSKLLYGESFREFSLRGAVSFTITLIVAGLISYAFIKWIDKPIENLRNRIRARQDLPAQTTAEKISGPP